MFKAIKEFFVGKPAPVVDAIEPGGAPYKVPESAATIPVPLVVEPVASSEDRTVVSLETPVPISVATVTVESPVKATREPRAPKSAPVAAVKEKAPAKAKAPKLTVVKAEKPAKSKKA